MHTCQRKKRGPTVPRHVAMDSYNQIRQAPGWSALYEEWKENDLKLKDPDTFRYETSDFGKRVVSLWSAPVQDAIGLVPSQVACAMEAIDYQSNEGDTISEEHELQRPSCILIQAHKTLLFDVFFLIGKSSNVVDIITALALTSYGYHKMLKEFHRGLIPLTYVEPCEFDEFDEYGDLIVRPAMWDCNSMFRNVGEWLGQKYHLSLHRGNAVFLNSAVYNRLGDRTLRVHERRFDYKMMQQIKSENESPRYNNILNGEQHRTHVLPNPHNKGEAWYDALCESTGQWKSHWKATKIWKDNWMNVNEVTEKETLALLKLWEGKGPPVGAQVRDAQMELWGTIRRREEERKRSRLMTASDSRDQFSVGSCPRGLDFESG
ncbi:uncharacterized protein RCO7_11051 [Rhynchosporium graminicola]|uniref:Uncharacterized protein n=1 Tax=Rhynchosporium graminicola TaxID=2792576 RepID=A0A1E1KVN8_9HELO|nr:uncharacterized protein RCO7_11051 [Rhynchosporium commune]